VVTVTLHVLGQVGLNFQVSVPQILAAIFTCALIEAVLTFRRTKSFVWPASAMLTGSGIALILRVTTTPVGDHWTFHRWWIFAGVAALAMATKYLVRHKGNPVFNPSNVALVLAFVVLGSSVVEPLDFWWAPLNGWMFLAYVIILTGGCLITARLHLLLGALTFWAILAAGTGLLAALGHCMTARWAFAPVCGVDYWRAIVTSPEVAGFMFVMITDPKTVPRGRVGHVMFCSLVAVASLLLMAPQTTEFWTKVGLLGGLTLVCALRLLLERWIPARGSDDDRLRAYAKHAVSGGEGSSAWQPALRITAFVLVGALVIAGVTAGGLSSRGVPVADASDILSRVPRQVNPATLPAISVEQGVLDWNHEISGAGAEAIVLTLVENLEVENEALRTGNTALLEAVDHGDRLDEMQQRLAVAQSTGLTTLRRYQIDDVHVRLLIPFGKQDGLSLGLESTGTVTTETYDRDGTRVERSTEPFSTMWAVRRVTGGRWMTVAERAPGSEG